MTLRLARKVMWHEEHAGEHRYRWSTKRAAILRTNRDYFRQAQRGRLYREPFLGRGAFPSLEEELGWSRWWDDRRAEDPTG